jgi:RNA polymerase sigma-70 factor (ECF subfamily)
MPSDRSTASVTDRVALELVERARQGDTRAFGELVDLHRSAVYRAALAALRSPADAEDVAQEAFVTAYRKLDGFRGEASFKTWLLAIAWRKALDRRGSLGRRLRLMVATKDDERGAGPIDRLPDGGPSQEEALLSAELVRNTRRLIGTLPAKLRDALLLVGSGECTYEEAAAMTGAPVGTVKWRVSEARRILKRKLAALGYGHD